LVALVNPATHAVRDVAQQLTVATGEPATAEAEHAEDRAVARQPASDRFSAQQPIRVHVEGDAERATVWLGMDASASLDIPAVTRAIALWLSRAGYGQPTWICNGQALVPDEFLAGESPGTPIETHRRARVAAPLLPITDQPNGESA
jgi:hypothetical protein